MSTEADKSFMGDHILVQPVTTNEFQMFTSAIFSMLQRANSFIPHPTVTPPISSCMAPRMLMANDDPSPWSQVHIPNSQQAAPTKVTEPTVLGTDVDHLVTPDMDSTTSGFSMATNLPMMDVNIPDLPWSKGTWEWAIAQ